MTKWYRVDWACAVQSLDVVKATDKCLFYEVPLWDGTKRIDRMAKSSEGWHWFPSEREALEDAVAQQSKQVELAKDNLQRKRTRLGQLESALRNLQDAEVQR